MPRANDITADELVASGRSELAGFSFRETAGSSAVVRVYDSTSAAGVLLLSVSLAAGESVGEVFPRALDARNGIFVDVVSGTVEGSVFT